MAKEQAKKEEMNANDVKELITAFKGYRDLLTPIQSNLSDFIETYDSINENIERLNSAFGDDIKGKLDAIYKNLSAQAEKASDLSSRIDRFSDVTSKYLSDITRLMNTMGKLEERVRSVNELEARAEEQIGRLDELLLEKTKSYNIKDLQRTLDVYNNNVQRVSEFINKDVADTLGESKTKLDSIKGGIEGILQIQKDGSGNIERLLENYSTQAELLRRISEKQDVNEAYIFDIIDKWAEERDIRKKGKK